MPESLTSVKGRGRKGAGRGLWLFLGLLVLAGAAYLAGTQADLSGLLRPRTFWLKLGRPLVRTTFFISLGLLVGQLIESLGWTSRLGRLVWPLIKRAHLPGPAGTAFTAAFVSGVLANSILVTAWQEGRLDRRGLVLANLLCNSLPMFVLHLPTTLFIALSLTGPAGVLYLGLMLMAAVVRFLGVTAAGRLMMPSCAACALEAPGPRRPWRRVWGETWPKFQTRLRRLIVVVVPVYCLVVLLAESGFFEWLRLGLARWVTSAVFPVEAMSLVIFSLVAEFTSGFAAAGALLEAGALAVRDAVLALMIGNVVSTPLRALRHQLPQYMGLFSPGFGLRLMLVGQGARVLSVVLVTLAFALLYRG
ncbi:MAG: hypothetical protein AB1896_08670 [Thermodesulfobacteriota bacterium]